MPDINNTLATQVQPPQQNDPLKAISTLSQLELARAHAGLYGLQAQQQARQLNALQQGAAAYNSPGGGDAAGAYLGAGGDPAGAVSLQNVQAQRDLRASGGGYLPSETQALAGAGKDTAETNKTNSAIYGQVGNILATNGSAGIPMAMEMAKRGGVEVPPLLVQKFSTMSDGDVRQAGKQLQAYGTPPATASEPVKTTPNESVWNRGSLSYGSGPSAGQTGQTQPSPTTGDILAPQTPNQTVQNRFPGQQPLIQGNTTAQTSEQEGYGKSLGEILPKLDESGDSAVRQNALLDQMNAASQSFRLGWGSQGQQTARTLIQAFGEQFPSLKQYQAFQDADKATGDFQDFYKLSTELVRQATKETSPRASQQEMMFIAKALPGPDLSRGGFNAITGQMGGLNDFLVAKQKAGHAWFDKNGTMAGFDSDWNQNISPGAFIAHRYGSNPDMLTEMKSNMEKTPEGKAVLGNIIKQLNWGKNNGAF